MKKKPKRMGNIEYDFAPGEKKKLTTNNFLKIISQPSLNKPKPIPALHMNNL